MRNATFDEFGKLNLKHLEASVEVSNVHISYSWKWDKKKGYLNRKHLPELQKFVTEYLFTKLSSIKQSCLNIRMLEELLNTSSLAQGPSLTVIFMVRKLRPRVVKSLAQSHTME